MTEIEDGSKRVDVKIQRKPFVPFIPPPRRGRRARDEKTATRREILFLAKDYFFFSFMPVSSTKQDKFLAFTIAAAAVARGCSAFATLTPVTGDHGHGVGHASSFSFSPSAPFLSPPPAMVTGNLLEVEERENHRLSVRETFLVTGMPTVDRQWSDGLFPGHESKSARATHVRVPERRKKKGGKWSRKDLRSARSREGRGEGGTSRARDSVSLRACRNARRRVSRSVSTKGERRREKDRRICREIGRRGGGRRGGERRN